MSNPDGTQTPATPAPAAPASSPSSDERSGEQIRDMRDVSRLVQQRESWKAKAQAYEAQLQGQKNAEAEAANQAMMTELEELRQFKAQTKAAAEKADAEALRLDRRTKVSDAILDGVHPDHKSTVELMLAGLHDKGHIDLYSETPEKTGSEAREALSKKFPQYFGGADGKQAGQPGSPGPDLTGVVVPTDIDPSVLAKMSDEQFKATFVDSGATDWGV